MLIIGKIPLCMLINVGITQKLLLSKLVCCILGHIIWPIKQQFQKAMIPTQTVNVFMLFGNKL